MTIPIDQPTRTPPSKPTRELAAARYRVPADQLTCFPLEKQDGASYEVMLSDHPMLAQVKQKQTGDAQRRETTMQEVLRRMDRMEANHDQEIRGLKGEMKKLKGEVKKLKDQNKIMRQQLKECNEKSILDWLDIVMNGAAANIAHQIEPHQGKGTAEPSMSFETRILNAVLGNSATFQARKDDRPVLGSIITPSNVRKIFEGFDVTARNCAAHPHLRPPKMVSDLFALEAIFYARRPIEGSVATILRAVLAASPLKEVREWMEEVRLNPGDYRQPTSEQLQRFAGCLL